jgi:hypothetical protein
LHHHSGQEMVCCIHRARHLVSSYGLSSFALQLPKLNSIDVMLDRACANEQTKIKPRNSSWDRILDLQSSSCTTDSKKKWRSLIPTIHNISNHGCTSIPWLSSANIMSTIEPGTSHRVFAGQRWPRMNANIVNDRTIINTVIEADRWSTLYANGLTI